MRYRTYYRKILETGEVQQLEFKPEHFIEAGVSYCFFNGMPLLESFELVNKWNRGASRFVYWLT